MGAFRVYTGEGRPTAIATLAKVFDGVSVVLVGEEHDDSIAHRVEALLFSEALRRDPSRPVVLSLEMFERDVQRAVDDYVSGRIDERTFLAATRPWAEYATAYRPLVELAKARGARVIAANAPRRYVTLVSRDGEPALARLPADTVAVLAPLPLPPVSAAYRAGFDSVMAEPGQHEGMPAHAFDGQRLWDAAMASAIAGALRADRDALVLHVSGGFHVERRLGLPEALGYYRPGTVMLTVTTRAVPDPAEFDARTIGGLADFVVLTRK